MHTMYLPSLPAVSGIDLIVGGEEGRHAARVKRIDPGDSVRVLDGCGGSGLAKVRSIDKANGEWTVTLRVDTVQRANPLFPAIDVCSAVPKGPRLEEMIDSLSQVGAASWRPLLTARSVAGPPRQDRLQRIAAEAGKQCGRAWFLELGAPIEFSQALRLPGPLLAHADGSACSPSDSTDRVSLLVGPEGGWSPEELAAAHAAGVPARRFGPLTMRIETAAPVAAAILLQLASTPRCANRTI